MIQTFPRCFGCERQVEYGAVYAPPTCDHEECPSAVFHGLCLMEWRERREQLQERAREAFAAFLRHVSGECGCPEQDREAS